MSADTSAAIHITPVLMPKIGQAMIQGTVIEWHAEEGQRVDKEVLLVTVETDKASYDLDAPASGRLHIYVGQGQEVAVGTVLAEIGDAPRRVSAPPLPVAAPARTAPAEPRPKRVLASPKAKRLAAEHGLDLARLTPSSPDGILSAADVERALAAAPTPAEVSAQDSVGDRRKLTGIRKTAAHRVQQAWQTIPHIVQMIDVDATGLLSTRTRLRDEAPGLSLNDVILHTAAGVLARHPDLNVSLENDTLVYHDGVDIGFAVDSPRGLLVPVIRRAAQRSLGELAAESQRLIVAARSGRLGADDMGRASLTVSNLGMYGIRFGTPVINLGEPILIFVGAVEDRPRAVDGQLVIRPALTLSIAYDHRVADGVAAAGFTQSLKRALEQVSSAYQDKPQTALDRREIRTVSDGDAYTVHVRSQSHGWTLDEPTNDGGSDAGPDPVSAFLGALLSCLTIAFKATARRRRVTIERVEGHVKANPAGQVKDMRLTLEVWTPAAEEQLRAVLEPTKRSCYVSRLLKPELDYRLELCVHRTQ